MNEHDIVRTKAVLLTDRGQSVPKGSTGTVVGVWKAGVAYIVEFNDPQGLADADHNKLEKMEMTELDPRVVEYQRKFGKGPFLTGDSVVIRRRAVESDTGAEMFEPEVLLVQRGKWPGEGMWALPGGFMNADDESVLGCAVRELDEETMLRLEPLPANTTLDTMLKSCQRGMVVGDRPDRDPRARIVSHCFLFDLRVYPNVIATVEAADDAAAVTWKSVDEIEQMTLFADHNELITRVLKFSF